jgi:hypothetical protein
MGYRGKLAEREQARRLRATGLPIADIAARLGVSKSSVSLWVRDVAFEPRPLVTRGRRREPNALQRRRQAQIDRLLAEGRDRVGRLSEREFLVAGVALYAGEGSKRDGGIIFANSDPGWSLSSARGCGASSRSTSPACGFVSTSTRDSIWPPRRPSGPR